MPTEKKPKTRSILTICREGRSNTGVSYLLIESPMTGRQIEGFVARLCFRLDLDPEIALELVIKEKVGISKSRTIPWLNVVVAQEETLTRMMQIIDFEYRKALKELRLS
ncbi:MAG: hypothetical protein WBB94_02065 [Candidatus Saccharimonadaceae bacterium]